MSNVIAENQTMVILASQSPYRKAQLAAFGIPFSAQAPKADEDGLKKSGPSDPEELTRFLARKKAESLITQFPGALIIGSDQLAEFAGRRLDKPGSKPAAFAQLQTLSGQNHRLITSVTVLRAPRADEADVRRAAVSAATWTEVSRIRLRPLSDETINAYLDLDQPFDCAGAYKIERAGMGLIAEISGKDPSAIQGLPLVGLTQCFAELGFTLAQLWRTP